MKHPTSTTSARLVTSAYFIAVLVTSVACELFGAEPAHAAIPWNA